MEQFIKEFFPEVAEAYKRYIRKDNPPAISSVVMSLRNGFGGDGGQTLTVTDINDKYLILTNKKGEKYASGVDVWWKELKIIVENN